MLFNFEGLDKNLKKYGGVPEALQTCGGVAQLGEHLPCKQGVRSSILLISTTSEQTDGQKTYSGCTLKTK